MKSIEIKHETGLNNLHNRMQVIRQAKIKI
jgi:hypothetical protein